MPGYQVLASVKPFTGACALNFVQYALYGSSAASRHSVKGYVLFSEKAALADCGRLGRLSVTDGSFTAASPVRRYGSKCESTMSNPPFAP